MTSGEYEKYEVDPRVGEKNASEKARVLKIWGKISKLNYG